jgi:hypothetical protein
VRVVAFVHACARVLLVGPYVRHFHYSMKKDINSVKMEILFTITNFVTQKNSLGR